MKFKLLGINWDFTPIIGLAWLMSGIFAFGVCAGGVNFSTASQDDKVYILIFMFVNFIYLCLWISSSNSVIDKLYPDPDSKGNNHE